MILRALSITFAVLLITFPLCGKEEGEESEGSLTSLIESVLSSPDSLETETEVPSTVSEIVKDYFSEAIFDDSMAVGVLDFLGNVYSEHGYYSTGNWAKPSNSYRYAPYKGDLPEFEYKDFELPVKGKLSSGFGYRPKFQRHHKGVDLTLNIGDTVVSALPGVVVKTGYERGGYGRYVVVAHSGGVETLYAHLSVALVKPGQKTETGTPIGLGGLTGNSTGPHLHFETRYLGIAIDPISWFNQGGWFR